MNKVAIPIFCILLCSTAGATSFDLFPASGDLGAGQIWVWTSWDGHLDKCLLDSGARISVVKNSPDFAHYEVVGQDFTTGVSGNMVPVDLINLNHIEVGVLTFANRVVRRQDAAPFNCLIGNDLLRTQSLYFDFQKNKVTTGLAVSPQDSFPLMTFNEKWVGFPVVIAGNEFEAFWDIGAGFTVVDPSLVENDPSSFTFLKEIEMADATGDGGKAKLYRLKSLKFGDYEVKDTIVVAYSLHQVQIEVPAIKVIFGYNVIRQMNWYIDNVNGRWKAQAQNPR